MLLTGHDVGGRLDKWKVPNPERLVEMQHLFETRIAALCLP
jgi:hypothetical protein